MSHNPSSYHYYHPYTGNSTTAHTTTAGSGTGRIAWQPNITADSITSAQFSPAQFAPGMVSEVEVLVRKCPDCEEVKRVDECWNEDDYICLDCR
jgi:hypothetical protein